MKTSPFSKTYEGRKVLQMPEYEFVKGKIYAVVGANGSGKSTLAEILSGTVKPDGCEKIWEETPSVGFMPQKSYAFGMTVKKNLLLSSKDKTRADKLMLALKIDKLSDKNAHRLSGGETQRMALARLFMREYDLLIFDEPTASMDVESTLLAERLMTRGREGSAVILITHSLPQASRMADEILFFHDGTLTEHGAAAKLLASPETAELKEYLDFCKNSR